MKFMIQLLGSMKLVGKYSVMTRVENVGAIFIPSMWISSTCMLIIMLRMELLREFLLSLLIMTATFSPKI